MAAEEAWMCAKCAPAELADLLLRLRMLCEPDRTHLFYYEETLLQASEKRAESKPAQRSQMVWRLRNEARKDLENDSALCTFDMSLELASVLHNKTIVVERTVNRTVAAESANRFALKVRHRTTSGYASSGISFFEQCGLERTVGPVAYYGRRYAHYLGVFVEVYTTNPRAPDEPYTVEFSAKISPPDEQVGDDENNGKSQYDEKQVASRIARLVSALSKWLHDLPEKS